ncbi:MAG: NAD-dependent epimerase/dehydratase family protein [Myxococcaceae bacterium]|jgi:nucleoside-diphosphate-sugar epimerase|nr:NAD-dependent epimerase/dehydratase family protein [Myxococcaceae bacterium]
MRHVVLGAGPVGRSAASALAGCQQDVVIVSRAAPPGLPRTVRHVAADVLDGPALERACEGADVVYQCLNAPYHLWPERFPPLQEAAVRAARAVKARYVSFENVYAYGLPGAAPFSEGQPAAPCSGKGRVRAAMSEALARLYAQGVLEVTFVRASDLFGPGMRASAMGDEFIGRAVAGKGARGFGDLDAPHTWTYTRDAGATLAAAGLSTSWGHVWHVPSDRPRSQREVAAELSRLLAHAVPLSSTPPFVLGLLGLFRPEVKALVEMAYEFDRPFVVGDEKTRAALGLASTPFADALEATVRWFRGAATTQSVQRAPREGAVSRQTQ